ncbi:MAG: urea ABC transporter permease subunit UrtB [Pigmentiphaga sp.]
MMPGFTWTLWRCRQACLLLALCLAPWPALAMTPDLIADLNGRDFAARAAAIDRIVIAVAEGDAQARQWLRDLADNRVPQVRLNNALRRKVADAAAVLELTHRDPLRRDAAVTALLRTPPPAEFSEVVNTALAQETLPALRTRLTVLAALVALQGDDAAGRLNAVHQIGASGDPRYRAQLRRLLEREPGGSWVEASPTIREAAQKAIATLDRAEQRAHVVGTVFAGLSLGSILLLAALGLAITYGLMGVINLAHGEFLMVGAYATYLVQKLFRQHFPAAFDWYPLAALPMAFIAAALVGVMIERLVIRHLYGRPLETLLTTFGISLLLMQGVRMIFGAQNVEVMNPSWMSGAVAIMPGLLLPWNRLVIIAFALVVVLATWLVLNRTRLGLFVRATTQNRTMAACAGVPTASVDTRAFALGAGVAGLGGCALSQVGNVGPDLGQAYIIDSFMVVVLGGVGQLAGTVVGALGLGIMNKMMEPFWGAVLAKVAVLLLIILFIQKRPQGLFALKGRSVEA